MQEFQTIALKELRESKTNPRRTFAVAGMEDLVKSIREKGVLVPLLVRPIQDGAAKFEIVAGARRYRAAKQACLLELPARVLALSDAEALEMQVVENLQREDVHPLEEAAGYATLMTRNKLAAEEIAVRIGKSVRYVYARLQLATLIDEVQKAFLDEKISASHAILMARLQPAQQKEALANCILDISRHEDNNYEKIKAAGTISVREFDRWIKVRFFQSLAAAPWKKDDATLLPKAGPCTTCPKRTGNAHALFGDVKDNDRCTDPGCYDGKLEAHRASVIAVLKKNHDQVLQLSTESYDTPKGALKCYEYKEIAAKKPCPHAVPGVFVHGKRLNQTTLACVSKKCSKHWPEYRGTGGGTVNDDQRRHQAQDRARERKRLQKQELRRRIVTAVLNNLKPLTRPDWLLIAEQFFQEIWHEKQKRVATLFGWKVKHRAIEPFIRKLTEKEMPKYLMCCALAGEAIVPTYWVDKGAPALMAAAKRHGVSVKLIEHEYQQELAAKKKDRKTKKVKVKK